MHRTLYLTAVLTCIGFAPPIAPDPVIVDPQHYKIGFENSAVRVLRVTYGPHEKSVMHFHSAGVAVSMTDQHVKFNMPDGKAEEARFNAGDTSGRDAGEHLPENLSDSPFQVISVELKNKPAKPLVMKQKN
jgi:hypothetical protein